MLCNNFLVKSFFEVLVVKSYSKKFFTFFDASTSSQNKHYI